MAMVRARSWSSGIANNYGETNSLIRPSLTYFTADGATGVFDMAYTRFQNPYYFNNSNNVIIIRPSFLKNMPTHASAYSFILPF